MLLMDVGGCPRFCFVRSRVGPDDREGGIAVSTAEAVEQLVAPVVCLLGIELVDVESAPGHLKVTIDREPPLDLGAISEATSAISRALDEADPVPGGRYELEVSSPGVERRLRRREHFARFVGSGIAVRLRAGAATDGERRFEGRLTAADENGIVIEVPTTGGTPRSMSYDDVERAHTLFDWRAALASAPSPPARHERRVSRPSAADRSRAAAAARAASQPAPGRSAGDAPHRARTMTSLTDPAMTDADPHLTETL
jgi:ribosome maturation factor RimP